MCVCVFVIGRLTFSYSYQEHLKLRVGSIYQQYSWQTISSLIEFNGVLYRLLLRYRFLIYIFLLKIFLFLGFDKLTNTYSGIQFLWDT